MIFLPGRRLVRRPSLSRCSSGIGIASPLNVQISSVLLDMVSSKVRSQVIITHVDRKLTRLLLVSPAQEHIDGPQWWTDYQPVSYNLTSKRGNRAQYQKLVSGLFLLGPIDFS